MGQNSTEVAYGFGQMGSVFTNLAKPIYPPKGHVIVAIQMVADATLSELHTETLDSTGPQYLTTEDTEATDANYIGVTEAAASGAGGSGVAVFRVPSSEGPRLSVSPGTNTIANCVGPANDTVATFTVTGKLIISY